MGHALACAGATLMDEKSQVPGFPDPVGERMEIEGARVCASVRVRGRHCGLHPTRVGIEVEAQHVQLVPVCEGGRACVGMFGAAEGTQPACATRCGRPTIVKLIFGRPN